MMKMEGYVKALRKGPFYISIVSGDIGGLDKEVEIIVKQSFGVSSIFYKTAAYRKLSV